MDYLCKLIKDEYYPIIEPNPRYRHAVRGIVINEKNEVGVVHIVGEDAFGVRDHYELPGGGIEENEDEFEALRREISEEIGYEITDIIPLGMIANEYHLLKRIDIQHFYIAKATKFVGRNLLDYEKTLFSETVWLPLDKIEEIYENYKVYNVGIEIHKRDLFAIKCAKELLK